VRHTSFSAGREAAAALRPIPDREAVVHRQRITAEAVHLTVQLGVDIPLGGAHDVRERARGAERGQSLAPAELLNVASTCSAAGRARRALVRTSDEAPLLGVIGGGIADLGPLRSLIDGAIDDRAELRDDASPELRAIRRELGKMHGRLQQRMQALLANAKVSAALQEPIVTMREGRYVLSVRSEARGAVPGVVHDTSASGATVFIEPMAVIDLGNEWRELQLQERHEIDRILRELSDAVGAAAGDLIDAVERLATIDLAIAKARLAKELDATDLARPGVDQPWIVDAPSELRLIDARHPLLEGDVVPISLWAGGEFAALLITGPNTGGKTVALKTAGLLSLMALAGLPVPAAAGTTIPVYEAIFADIGDEQSIEQSLSTFSGHITAIIDVIERAGPRSMVLLDELGAGTDPTEGAALAIAIVDRLVSAGATLIATTHHSELKLYAHQTPAVMNASVEFDIASLSPTYRLTIGLPGQSNALAIASRLGMPGDVIAAAREGLSTEERDVESLLGELRGQLAAAEQRAADTATDRAQARELRAELDRQLRELTAETERLREQAHARVRREVRDVERLVERTRREVEAARLEQARADLARTQEAVERIDTEAASELPEPPEPVGAGEGGEVAATHGPHRVEAGSVVWLRGVAAPGEALSAPDDRGEFDVQLGALHTRVRLEQVERTAAARTIEAGSTVRIPPAPPSAPEEIEVRGERIDEALPRIDAFIDLAVRAGRDRVRLIHGRGTGTLRRAVRELVAEHPLVSSFEEAGRGEGGAGVTIVHLQTN